MYNASSIIRTSIICTLMHLDTRTASLSGNGHIGHNDIVGKDRHAN